MKKYTRNGQTAKVTAIFYLNSCRGSVVVCNNKKVLAVEYLEMKDFSNFMDFVNKYFN